MKCSTHGSANSGQISRKLRPLINVSERPTDTDHGAGHGQLKQLCKNTVDSDNETNKNNYDDLKH